MKKCLKQILLLLVKIFLCFFLVKGGNNDEILMLTSHLMTNYMTKEEFIKECRQKLTIYRPNLSETQVYSLCIKALISSLDLIEKNPENRIANMDQIPKEVLPVKEGKKEYNDNKRGFKKLLKDVTDIFSSDIFFFDDILELDNNLFSDSILNFSSEYKSDSETKAENIERKQVKLSDKEETGGINIEKKESILTKYPEAYYPLAVEILTTMGIEDVNVWAELPTNLGLNVLIYYLFYVIEKNNNFEECDRHRFFINSIVSILKNDKRKVFPKNKTIQDIRYSLCKLGSLYKSGTNLLPFSIMLSLPKHSYDIWKSFGLVLQFEILIALSKSILNNGEINNDKRSNLFEKTKLTKLKKYEEKRVQDYLLNTFPEDETIPMKHFRNVLIILLKSAFGERSVYFNYKDNPFSLLDSEFGFPDKRDELAIKIKNKAKEREKNKKELVNKITEFKNILKKKNESEHKLKNNVNTNKGEKAVKSEKIEMENEDKGVNKVGKENNIEDKLEEKKAKDNIEGEKKQDGIEDGKKEENNIENERNEENNIDKNENKVNQEEEKVKSEMLDLIDKINKDNIEEKKEEKIEDDEMKKDVNINITSENNEEDPNIEHISTDDKVTNNSEQDLDKSNTSQKTDLGDTNNDIFSGENPLSHKIQDEIKSQVLEGEEHEEYGESNNKGDVESSHEEGNDAHVEGNDAHEEENDAYEEGNGAHVEGNDAHEKENDAYEEGNDAHEEENVAYEEGNDAHVEGNDAHEEENDTHVEENDAHVEENDAHVEENDAHVEENDAHVEENDAHAEENDVEESVDSHKNSGDEIVDHENEGGDYEDVKHENIGEDVNEHIDEDDNEQEHENSGNHSFGINNNPSDEVNIVNDTNNIDEKESDDEQNFEYNNFKGKNDDIGSTDNSSEHKENQDKLTISHENNDNNDEMVDEDINDEFNEKEKFENIEIGDDRVNENELYVKETTKEEIGDYNNYEDAERQIENNSTENTEDIRFEEREGIKEKSDDEDSNDTENKQNYFENNENGDTENEPEGKKRFVNNEETDESNENNIDRPIGNEDIKLESDDDNGDDIGVPHKFDNNEIVESNGKDDDEYKVDLKYEIEGDGDFEEKKVIMENDNTDDKYENFANELNKNRNISEGSGDDNIEDNNYTLPSKNNVDFYPVSQGEESDEEEGKEKEKDNEKEENQSTGEINNNVSRNISSITNNIDIYPVSQGEESDEEEGNDENQSFEKRNNNVTHNIDDKTNDEDLYSEYKREGTDEKKSDNTKESMNEDRKNDLSSDINYEPEENKVEKDPNDKNLENSEEDEIKLLENIMNNKSNFNRKSDQNIKSTVDSEEFTTEDELSFGKNDIDALNEDEDKIDKSGDLDENFDSGKKKVINEKNLKPNLHLEDLKIDINLGDDSNLGGNLSKDDDDFNLKNSLDENLVDFSYIKENEDFKLENILNPNLGSDSKKSLDIENHNDQNNLELERNLNFPDLNFEAGFGIDDISSDSNVGLDLTMGQNIAQDNSKGNQDSYDSEIKLLEDILENTKKNDFPDGIISTVDQESELDLYNSELFGINDTPMEIPENSLNYNVNELFEFEKLSGLDSMSENYQDIELSNEDMKLLNEVIDGTNVNSKKDNIEDNDLFIGDLFNEDDKLSINSIKESESQGKDANNYNEDIDDDEDLNISNLFENKKMNHRVNEMEDFDSSFNLDLLFEPGIVENKETIHDETDKTIELGSLFEGGKSYGNKLFEDDDEIINIGDSFLFKSGIDNTFSEVNVKLTNEEAEVINEIIDNTKMNQNHNDLSEELFINPEIAPPISKLAIKNSQITHNSGNINYDNDDIDISNTFLFNIEDNFLTQDTINNIGDNSKGFELSEGDLLLLNEIIDETNKQKVDISIQEDDAFLNSDDFISGSLDKRAILANSESKNKKSSLRGSSRDNINSTGNNIDFTTVDIPTTPRKTILESRSTENQSVKLNKISDSDGKKDEFDGEKEWILSFAPKLRPGRMEGRRDIFTEEEIQRAKREATDLG
ncbi:hypothetical protein FG379_002575 [Cryptosporidium bovis]|uniref:uncharacterized protein n=1 Tax=Cryptosporidium bovis TaxID=310047 RepID=UPI00351A794B|nr:hypothetical protein FG379_002575 [Cryptosporidium bovis]